MPLLLGQLVYTSFSGRGYRNVASAQVPTEIQQAFIQRVVSQHWDSYEPPKSEYRAVYLHQVSPEHTLFGWLYNDGEDDMGRNDVPYFHCYYLAEPLRDFQLENIFTCLQKGPLALIDRHSLPASLETIVVPTPWTFSDNFWSYQPAKPGVAIPLSVRNRSHIAWEQGVLLELFVPVEQQEMVIDRNAQSEEQEIGNLSIYTHYLVEGIETGAAALNEDAAVMESGVTKTYRNERLQIYEQALVEAIESEYPLSDNTRNSLKRLQQILRLTDEDIEPNFFKSPIQKQQKKLVSGAIKSKNVTPLKALNEAFAVKEANTRSRMGTVFPQILSSVQSVKIGSRESDRHNSVLAYRNSQLLLRVGIVATVLALTGSIYGLVQIRICAPSKPELIPSESSHILFKNLRDASGFLDRTP